MCSVIQSSSTTGVADAEGVGESPSQSKQPRYQLAKEQRGTIKADTVNKKMWDDLLATIRAVSPWLCWLLHRVSVCVCVCVCVCVGVL